MVKPMDSAALDLVDKVLGLAKGGVQVPSLDDGNVVITLPVIPEIVRRSNILAVETGWRFGVLRCELDNGEPDRTASIDPYEPGTVIANYPSEVPDSFDVWIAAASVRLTLGGGAAVGDFGRCYLQIDPAADQQAWGETDSGGGLVTSDRFVLAQWNSGATVDSETYAFRAADGEIWPKIGMRVPRGAELVFSADATLGAGETIDADCYMIVGTFPVSLGHDVTQ